MKRRCIQYNHSDTFNRFICVDEGSADEIFQFLDKRSKQLKTLSDHILELKYLYYTNYCSLKGWKKMTEMRFNVGGGNGRIYCKEVVSKYGTLCVVMSKLWNKKASENIDKKILPLLEEIDTYEYEIIYEDEPED